MKIIILEEHFQLAEIKKAVAKMLPSFADGFHLPACDAPDLLFDFMSFGFSFAYFFQCIA